ncbi:MAG: hypothetical protein K6U14_05295 [Firmicutes bacterium]|nr:hypothetical protein [Alicyclobacillaceae bacterium]MCL6497034.1 hypothetical protein [Bacillota bacterium]
MRVVAEFLGMAAASAAVAVLVCEGALHGVPERALLAGFLLANGGVGIILAARPHQGA